MHIDFFQDLPKTKRGDRVTRRAGLTHEEITELKEYGQEYFDGELGYGGYHYDGRWKPVAEELIMHYGLNPDSKVLEVGCAKGFLMYELYKLGITNVHGCDISSYAVSQAPEEIAENFKVMSADYLAYKDSFFDLVLSIDCINNLESEGVDRAIEEMMRVSGKDIFIRVGSHRNHEEYEHIIKWAVTSLTFDSPDEWFKRFENLGYRGDYYFRFMDNLE